MPEGRRRGDRGGLGRAAREARLNPGASRSEDPRRALRELAISLARKPDIITFARALIPGRGASRVARVAAVFTFVSHLVDVPPADDQELRDGVDLLLRLAGENEGPAVILSALLQALGERAAVEYAPGFAFVKLELAVEDLARLPPHAGPFAARGRYFLPLDPRRSRSPLGFLPRPARESLRGL